VDEIRLSARQGGIVTFAGDREPGTANLVIVLPWFSLKIANNMGLKYDQVSSSAQWKAGDDLETSISQY